MSPEADSADGGIHNEEEPGLAEQLGPVSGSGPAQAAVTDDDDYLDSCCDVCGSSLHDTEEHPK